MTQVIKKIKQKQVDGTYSDYIPIGAESVNVTMADGETLENAFTDKIELHSVAQSQAAYIVKLSNNKTLIVDTGLSSEWTIIKNAIDSLNITKFDYMILTHFHGDHVGNIENLCTNYDFSNCKCWVQMKPDFTNHASDIAQTEADYDNVISLLQNKGITPIVPTNDSYFTIDKNTRLHFLNTSSQWATDNNYYTTQYEWGSNGKCNFNVFSLVTELIYKANVITFTGDIEVATEMALATYMRKSDILTAPHHGVNRAAYLPFYEATKPNFALLQRPSSGEGWLYPYFKSYRYLQEMNSEIITSYWSKAENGLFSFILNGDSIKTNVTGLGVPENKIPTFGETFYRIENCIDYFTQTAATVTLLQVIANLSEACTLSLYWYSEYNTTYPQLYADILALYPGFGADSYVKIEKIGGSSTACLRISKGDIEVMFRHFGNNWSIGHGSGQIANINSATGTTDLITALEKLPIGQYTCAFFKDSGDTVLSTSEYTLNIDLVEHTSTYIVASVIATLRSTDSSRTKVICSCYIKSSSTPKYSWKQLDITS